tara:strand:- start:1252 stop:1401 length:150 start_codon:yes stop_codon:yes gene_type:complete
MATYKEEQGTAVQNRSSSTGAVEGEVFYDTSTGTFKLIGAAGVETLNTN